MCCRKIKTAKKPGHCPGLNFIFWRRHPESNWGIKVLQTSALPLGYVAKIMERKARLELATPTLARWCSTTELFPHFIKILYSIVIFWRRHPESNWGIEVLQTSALPLGYVAKIWSGKRGSNSRPPPWQGGALPLSYFRIL
jgi:hypothetical protein